MKKYVYLARLENSSHPSADMWVPLCVNWLNGVLGMVLGSAISVFAKDHIHNAFRSLQGKRLGVMGIVAASVLGTASPLCMYGTIPLAASFSAMALKMTGWQRLWEEM